MTRNYSKKGYKHIFPNLLLAGYQVKDVNEVVVCDLTYFQNDSGLYYVFLITDVYSQRIGGATAAVDKRSIHALKPSSNWESYGELKSWNAPYTTVIMQVNIARTCILKS